MARPCFLLVEDEALLAMDVEATLRRAGYPLTGVAASVTGALRELRRCRPDAAILDVNLGGEPSLPVADELARLEIPFLFLTGHSREVLPGRHRGRPFLLKPVMPRLLLARVGALAGPTPPPSTRVHLA